MKKTLYGCLLFGGALLVLALVIFALSPPGQMVISDLFRDWRGPFDEPRFRAVVEEVRRRGIQPGEHLSLRLEKVDDPRSLRPHTRDDYKLSGEGNVWAIRKPGGELIVLIETRDFGHSGQYGYAYAESPPERQGYGDLLRLDAEQNLSCTDPDWEIEKNWWKVQACNW